MTALRAYLALLPPRRARVGVDAVLGFDLFALGAVRIGVVDGGIFVVRRVVERGHGVPLSWLLSEPHVRRIGDANERRSRAPLVLSPWQALGGAR
jgi:hypothetical protein